MPSSIRKPLYFNGCETLRELIGFSQNGEGGIRTHEGVTPTRFRVVRDQPDSATSPHALERATTVDADEP